MLGSSTGPRARPGGQSADEDELLEEPLAAVAAEDAPEEDEPEDELEVELAAVSLEDDPERLSVR